jgi:hypothetical protein
VHGRSSDMARAYQRRSIHSIVARTIEASNRPAP